MDVPLTQSGQFDDSQSHSVDNIAWNTVRSSAALSETGSNRGVVLVQLKLKQVIVKSSQEPAREMFLTRLCRHLGVSAPNCRFVPSSSKEHKLIVQHVRGLTKRPVFVVQEFVHGTTLSNIKVTPKLAQYFTCGAQGDPILRGLGRILALDCFCNNWDRVPLIHHNSGNFGNVILQLDGSQGRLIAIDNAMTGIRKLAGPSMNPIYKEYLNTFESLLFDVSKSGPKKECDRVLKLRSLLLRQCGLRLGELEGQAIQIGIAEMCLRLADFASREKLAEEKKIVSEMAERGTWYQADLERIDLEYLGDMFDIVKKHESAIAKSFKGSFY